MNEKRGISLGGAWRTIQAVSGAGLLHLLMLGQAVARPGDLDITFGTGGKVTIHFLPGGDGRACGVVVQSDGKILLGGESNYRDAVARFDATGRLDGTFADRGKLFQEAHGSAHAMVLVAGDKFIMAGTAALTSSGYNYFAMRRYTRNGSTDPTFGSDGAVYTYMGDYAGALDAAVQDDGKIVLVGYSQRGSERDFGVARYNADGSPDNTFGTAGHVTTDFGNTRDWCSGVALQSDGKILAAGYSQILGTNNWGSRFAVVRYTTNGTLDPTFGGSGKVTSLFGPSSQASCVAVQNDGKILLGGWVDHQFALARYSANGTLDTSFGTEGTGLVTMRVGAWDSWSRIGLQRDGKILAVGATAMPGHVVVARYNPDGRLDPGFGVNGAVLTAFGSLRSWATAFALQPDGKLLVAGTAWNTNSFYSDFALVRYENDAVVPPAVSCPSPTIVDCDTPAEVNVLIHNPSGLALTAVWSVNGQIVQTNALPATNAMTDVYVSFTAALPLGTNTVAITVTDTYANSNSCSTSVMVVDRSPPLILSAEATPNTLWPPNHRLVPVSITALAVDNCDSLPVVRITQVTSNQPEVPFVPDWEVTGELTLNLRAERAPSLGARIYTVFVEAIDASGNRTPETFTVTVPESRTRGSP